MTDIAIIDFGSQYANLICALLNDLGVSNTLLPTNTSLDKLESFRGLILSGGPASIHNQDSPQFSAQFFDIDLPMLGICYGHQMMAYAMGGEVKTGKSQEYGRANLQVANKEGVFSGFRSKEPVWMSHSDTVTRVPPGFVVAGFTTTCPVAAMYNQEKKRYGVQFHPEVSQTEAGNDLLQKFVVDICGCEIGVNTARIVEDLKKEIHAEVGEKNVILLLSGGVDSNVAFVLLAHSLGKERVYGLHVDTGLLRKSETENLVKTLQNIGLAHRLKIIDASKKFFDRLSGLKDAEEKRKTIASTFLDVKDKAMIELNLDSGNWLLAQGTLYTDLITSGLTHHAKVIKTHHNSLLKERESLTIIEPLKGLYKHQVRKIGVELGLPTDLIWREPYPGPGNGVRILGEVNRDRADLQREVDHIVSNILRKYGYHTILFQGFPVLAIVSDFDVPKLNDSILGTVTDERLEIVNKAKNILAEYFAAQSIYWQVVLPPLQTVGIKGDNRSFSAPLVVRVNSYNSWDHLDYETLENLSNDLTNKLQEVTRVVYDITEAGFSETGWDKLVFLRLITSREAMTADWAKVDYEVLDEIAHTIIDKTEVDRVMLDVTQKPPGMVEWE